MGARAAKGRVLVAVKRRRRSVRILLAACGDGVMLLLYRYARRWRLLLLFSVCRQRRQQCGRARLDAAMPRVKSKCQDESPSQCLSPARALDVLHRSAENLRASGRKTLAISAAIF